jgi:protein-S-isoprenylcysteine O-methyltransferase Ste14
MVSIGNFFFHYRNFLFPFFYLMLFVPSPRILDSFSVPVMIGLALCVTGQSIRAVTVGQVNIIRGGRNRQVHAKELITEGIFNHCRNPLYIGNIMILTGLGVAADSLLFLAVCVPLFVFAYQSIVCAEEHFLKQNFGKDYETYMHTVNRWVPRLRGFGETFRTTRVRWKRVILREFSQMFITSIGILVALMKNLFFNDHTAYHQYIRSAYVSSLFLLSVYLLILYLKKSKRLRDSEPSPVPPKQEVA